MSLSTLPLSYCANVHPASTLDDTIQGIHTYTSPLQKKLEQPIAAGLWLASSIIDEIEQTPGAIKKLQLALKQENLVCYTMNTFPYGNFHSDVVKDQVYIPNWSTRKRLEYTLKSARLLAELLPPGVEGSLSTVPLGFKPHMTIGQIGFQEACITHLLELARELDDLHDETGQVVRLAIEPEPYCVLETTAETIAFFIELFKAADEQGLSEQVRRHIGVCYDVCHQAVEFEDVTASIKKLQTAGIRINKVHITNAVELRDPLKHPAAVEALKYFVEKRYLHQTFFKLRNKTIEHVVDLTPEVFASYEARWSEIESARVHYHVPIFHEQIGPLYTTRKELRQALGAVFELEYAPHLEIETYTWGVLPDQSGSMPAKPDLVDGMSQEFLTTYQLLKQAAIPKTLNIPIFNC
jgi:sugar phosphate isomerase/epimerase